MKKCNLWLEGLGKTTFYLASVGAINWGLVAFWKINLVDYLDRVTGRIGVGLVLYALIGLSGLYALIASFVKCYYAD